MFRVLFTTYVSLVMLAGPSVCCCSMRGVAGCYAGDGGEPPAETRTGCCGHHAPHDDASGESTAVGEEAGGPSAPGDQPECPCRKNQTHVISEGRKQVADLQQVRSIVPAPLEVPSTFVTVLAVDEVGEHAQVLNLASHFGSAREFLRALRTYLI